MPEGHPLLSVNYVIAKAPENPSQTEVFSGKSGLKVYKDSSAFRVPGPCTPW